MESELDARAQQVLKALVRRHIDTGEPVGSRVLARESELAVSPATIRNIVAELEERGLVRSPHASAGRVPTSRGYRLFVALMLEVPPLAAEERAQIRECLYRQAADTYRLYQATGRLISGRTHYVGLVRGPRLAQGRFRQIEFLALAGGRILAILVTTAGLVQNRILEGPRAEAEAELERAANYLNERFAGWPLPEVKRRLAREKRAEAAPLAALAADLGWAALDGEAEDELVIEGQGNLLAYPELAQGERLRALFEVLEAPAELGRLLEAASDGAGVRLLIGEEAGYAALADCTVVTARYRTAEAGSGTVAVIGPARMDYAATIPFVDYTAQQLSSVLAPDASLSPH